MAKNSGWVDVSHELKSKPHPSNDGWVDVSHELPQPDEDNTMMAAATGIANGATFGYLPQIQAVVEKPIAQAIDYVAGTKIADEYPNSYTERRDEAALKLKEVKDKDEAWELFLKTNDSRMDLHKNNMLPAVTERRAEFTLTKFSKTGKSIKL